MKAKNLKVECISRNDESLLQIAINDFMLMNEDCEIDSVSFNVNTGASALIFYRKIPKYKEGNELLRTFWQRQSVGLENRVNEFLTRREIEMVSIRFTESLQGYGAYIMYRVVE